MKVGLRSLLYGNEIIESRFQNKGLVREGN